MRLGRWQILADGLTHAVFVLLIALTFLQARQERLPGGEPPDADRTAPAPQAAARAEIPPPSPAASINMRAVTPDDLPEPPPAVESVAVKPSSADTTGRAARRVAQPIQLAAERRAAEKTARQPAQSDTPNQPAGAPATVPPSQQNGQPLEPGQSLAPDSVPLPEKQPRQIPR